MLDRVCYIKKLWNQVCSSVGSNVVLQEIREVNAGGLTERLSVLQVVDHYFWKAQIHAFVIIVVNALV